MPQEKVTPIIEEADLQAEALKLSGQTISDSYALSVVRQTFYHYEPWRRNNHDPRWVAADSLYFGNVEKRVWEGTNIPRASLSQPIVFDQIEAAFPVICGALFGSEEWFEVLPGQNGNPAEARNVRDYLHYLLEQAVDEFGGTARVELKYAIKDVLKYGNGGIMLEYDPVRKHPTVQYVELRDIYIDPGTPTASIDTAKSLVHRRLMTVDELDSLRDDPRMNIPEKDVLVHMSGNRMYVAGDLNKQYSEAARSVQFTPGAHDNLPLPADKMIEVLVYWSKSRVIWVLNREWVAYNQKNPYGFIPYCFAPCFVVEGRFYGMSFSDVIGDVQLYIQALRNLRLDELHLAIMPPRVRKRGVALNPQQLKWRPNVVTEVENPRDDMVVHFPSNASSGVADEVMSLEISAEKRTGVNSIGMGVPRGGNVNRTATGVQSQLQGSASRLQPIVENIEDFLIVPMLYKLQRMTQIHGKIGEKLPTFADGTFGQADVLSVFSPVRFIMRGSSKMMTREQLAQLVPFITQYMLNGAFIGELGKTGLTIDFQEFLAMIQDATGIKQRYSLVRQMNEQEKQAMNQPDPKTQMEMQRAQMDQQTKLQMSQMAQETEIRKTEEASALKILEMLLADLAESSSKNADVDRQKAVIELQKMVSKMQLDQQRGVMDLVLSRDRHGQQLEQERQSAETKILADNMMSENEMRMRGLSGMQDLQLSEAQAQQKMRQIEAMSMLGAGKPARDTEARKKRAEQKGK